MDDLFAELRYCVPQYVLRSSLAAGHHDLFLVRTSLIRVVAYHSSSEDCLSSQTCRWLNPFGLVYLAKSLWVNPLITCIQVNKFKRKFSKFV